jgi:hypothetical protein
MNTTFQQTSQAGKTTGSLINWMMGNNKTLPVAGKGATVLSWTDRHAYQVMSVSADFKTVILQACISERTDKNGFYTESQKYDYSKLSGVDKKLVWKWNKWRWESDVIIFTEEYSKTIGPKSWEDPEHKALWDDNNELRLVEGKTKTTKQYSEVKIIFGVQEEYRDPCF